ncbi:hypothetical protein CK203_096075 [Vitis vinifera]|uniref:Uncharacterized protein n=1 Tax=Vitis vinifera TaxID=29760 RepID=A0A438CGU0_VITVI|nr:hypothetical protein CK203_096075 [Vitis vinifera]
MRSSSDELWTLNEQLVHIVLVHYKEAKESESKYTENNNSDVVLSNLQSMSQRAAESHVGVLVRVKMLAKRCLASLLLATDDLDPYRHGNSHLHARPTHTYIQLHGHPWHANFSGHESLPFILPSSPFLRLGVGSSDGLYRCLEHSGGERHIVVDWSPIIEDLYSPELVFMDIVRPGFTIRKPPGCRGSACVEVMTTLYGSTPSLRRRAEGCVPPEGSQFRSRLSLESHSWRRVGGRLIIADSYPSSDSSAEMSDELASALASIQEFMPDAYSSTWVSLGTPFHLADHYETIPPHPRAATHPPPRPYAQRPARQFTPLGMTLTRAFEKLKDAGVIIPLAPRPLPHPIPPHFRSHEHCLYHQIPGHDTKRCSALHHAIQDLIDSGLVDLAGPNVTTNPLPTHSTHAVPLPPSLQ